MRTIGGDAATAEALGAFICDDSSDQPELTDESPERGMIGPVTAEYVPPVQP